MRSFRVSISPMVICQSNVKILTRIDVQMVCVSVSQLSPPQLDYLLVALSPRARPGISIWGRNHKPKCSISNTHNSYLLYVCWIKTWYILKGSQVLPRFAEIINSGVDAVFTLTALSWLHPQRHAHTRRRSRCFNTVTLESENASGFIIPRAPASRARKSCSASRGSRCAGTRSRASSCCRRRPRRRAA